MKKIYNTGFKCPECHQEATYKGILGGFFQQVAIDNMLERLNSVGGVLKSECGHRLQVVPGSRSPA